MNPLSPKMRKAISLVAISLALFSSVALAETDPAAKQKGFEIAARSDRSDRGFTDSRVTLKMILKNKAGQESVREMTQTTLEVPDEDTGDKNLILFLGPADIEGTALLSHAKILDPDDQWLYLPALKRVKRISSVNKSGPFVGSEFAFEDFTAQELKKFDYAYVGEEACGTFTCDIIERYPLYDHSGYTKQVSWIDQTHYQIRKVDFYDRRGDLLKTLTLSDYKEYDGGVWRPHLMAMINHQTGKSTDLIYQPYAFKQGLGDNDFVKGVLKRLR